MFFYLSKILGFFLIPINLLVVAILLSFWLLRRGRIGAVRFVLACASGFIVLVQFTPLPELMLFPLEQRFKRPDPMPERVDGIVLLGGAQRPLLTKRYGQPALNAAAETLTSFTALARRYPNVKLVFTGGSGDPLNQHVSEAETVRLFMREQGLDPNRVIYEERSRTTYENALYTKALVQAQAVERWLMIAAAASMPRAIGAFRQAQWEVIAYPADYNTGDWRSFRLSHNFRDRFTNFGLALHEWVGLAVYHVSGRSNALFPAP